MEQLNNRLQMYTYHGLPKVPFHSDSWEEEEPNLTLEESWQQLLENPEVSFTLVCLSNSLFSMTRFIYFGSHPKFQNTLNTQMSLKVKLSNIE